MTLRNRMYAFMIFAVGMASSWVVYPMQQENLLKKRFTHHDQKPFQKEVSKYVKMSLQSIPEAIFNKNQKIKKLYEDLDIVERIIAPNESKMLSAHVQRMVHTVFEQIVPLLEAINQIPDHNQSLRLGILLRLAVPLTIYGRAFALRSLMVIDRHLNYWENALAHPVHYFFHKSPARLVQQQSQREEIKKNIKNLRAREHAMHSFLGLLVAHLGDYNPYDVQENQYYWITGLVTILQSLYDESVFLNIGLMPQKVSDDLAQQLINTFQSMRSYEKDMNHRLAKMGKPNHASRNWIWYSAGALSAVCAGVFLVNNYEKIPVWFDTVKNAVWNRVINTPFKALKDAFWSHDKPEDNQQFAQKVDKSVDEIQKFIGHGTHDINEVKKIFKETMDKCKTKECLSQKYINNYEQQIALATQDIVIPGAANNSEAIHMIEDAINNISKKMSGLSGNSLWNILRSDDTTSITLLVPLINLMTHAYKIKAKAITGEGSELFKLLTNRARKLLHDSERTLTQNKATAALAAIVPAGLLLYGGYKAVAAAYRGIKGKKRYTSIQRGLVDIAHILNFYNDNDAYPADMGPADYGKLVYLLHKLRTEAYNVPEECRVDYLDDIKKLTSGSITAKKKMKVIDLMYKSYPFLNVHNA